MNLKVWEPKKEEVKKEEQYFLKLVESDTGISLIMVNEEGRVVLSPYILKITNDGKCKLNFGVNSSVGLDLVSGGKIRVI